MAYSVKEIYYTLQGEGNHVGRPAVFCRFAGCNLWTGREVDRSHAVCQFCDTDFLGTDGPGGGKFPTAQALARAVKDCWPTRDVGQPYVVCTGGEPLLQLDPPLIEALHDLGLEVGVETNGTVVPPVGLDWICVSPKANSQLILTEGDELKLVYPQLGGEPERYESLRFSHFYLQPMDGPARTENTRAAIQYCLANPKWKLSLQSHKIVGIA